ncbi:hypothetical protein V6Z11_D06G219700 [Gossypium hirsutum]
MERIKGFWRLLENLIELYFFFLPKIVYLSDVFLFFSPLTEFFLWFLPLFSFAKICLSSTLPHFLCFPCLFLLRCASVVFPMIGSIQGAEGSPSRR